jgi:hypothetical protein
MVSSDVIVLAVTKRLERRARGNGDGSRGRGQELSYNFLRQMTRGGSNAESRNQLCNSEPEADSRQIQDEGRRWMVNPSERDIYSHDS